jgi:hypothetical protein
MAGHDSRRSLDARDMPAREEVKLMIGGTAFANERR